MSSNWSQIPYGAIVAGHKPDGGPLYVAQILRGGRWWAGNYDPDKPCAEYIIFYGPFPVICCDEVWKLLVVKYGRFKKILFKGYNVVVQTISHVDLLYIIKHLDGILVMSFTIWITYLDNIIQSINAYISRETRNRVIKIPNFPWLHYADIPVN